jgi:adenosylmethionine-8-amino-7-oxononanoate aminotransferase
MSSFDPGRRTFVRGAGTLLFDSQGKATFDAVSSIWTIVHGHCHPAITEAIARQARELDHSTALGASNPVAERLAQRLCAATGLSRVFYSSDGASAVEASLKIARQFWQNAGEPQRRRFIHLRSSYHGDTVGAMSVSDIPVFRDRFDDLCFEAVEVDPSASCASVENALRRPDIAAVILEPLVQAAAGMRVLPPRTYQPFLENIAPLVIADEIATGFGRTGTLFAFEQLGLRPDLICLGKGLTGGALALSAVLATKRVFEAFLSPSSATMRHFFHGHSYSGNPIACAAACASLDLFDVEDTLAHVGRLARHLAQLASQLLADERVREVRTVGLMCGIELREERLTARSLAPTPAWGVANAMYDRGQFTRPIGNVIQLVPPLSSSPNELDTFMEALSASL